MTDERRTPVSLVKANTWTGHLSAMDRDERPYGPLSDALQEVYGHWGRSFAEIIDRGLTANDLRAFRVFLMYI